MDYSVDIDWTSGGLSGTSSTIFLTLDELTSTGIESFTPDGGAGGALVSFEVTFDGLTFTAADDIVFPTYPYVQFVDGVVDELAFISVSYGTNTFMFVVSGGTTNSVEYFDSAGQLSNGEFNISSFAPIDPVDVPVPATLALFGLGLVGLSLTRRKRVAHS